MKEKKIESRIVPMNDEIYDGLFLEELEARLETDPLLPGGLLTLMDGGVTPQDDCPCYAGIKDECLCHGGTLIECPCRGKELYV